MSEEHTPTPAPQASQNGWVKAGTAPLIPNGVQADVRQRIHPGHGQRQGEQVAPGPGAGNGQDPAQPKEHPPPRGAHSGQQPPGAAPECEHDAALTIRSQATPNTLTWTKSSTASEGPR